MAGVARREAEARSAGELTATPAALHAKYLEDIDCGNNSQSIN
jgi:hypothetical protein